MDKINKKINDKVSQFFIITIGGVFLLFIVAVLCLIFYETFPYSYYITLGLTLAWCVVYKIIEWREL